MPPQAPAPPSVNAPATTRPRIFRSRGARLAWTAWAALLFLGLLLVPAARTYGAWEGPQVAGDAFDRLFYGNDTRVTREWVAHVDLGNNPFPLRETVHLPYAARGAPVGHAPGPNALLTLNVTLYVNGERVHQETHLHEGAGGIYGTILEDEELDIPLSAYRRGVNEVRVVADMTWHNPGGDRQVHLRLGPLETGFRGADRDLDALADDMQAVAGVNSLLLAGLLAVAGVPVANRFARRGAP